MHNKQAISLSGDKTGRRRTSDKSNSKKRENSCTFLQMISYLQLFINILSIEYHKCISKLYVLWFPGFGASKLTLKSIQITWAIASSINSHQKVTHSVTSTMQQWPFSTELSKSGTFSKLSGNVFTTYLRINNHMGIIIMRRE